MIGNSRQVAPDCFGDVGHEGVEQTQGLLECVGENLAGCGGGFGVAAVEAWFGGLDVPVAVFTPEELVELATGFAQLPVFD